MQDINAFGKAHCVNGSIGITSMVFHKLQNPRALEPFEWFCTLGAFAHLRDIQSIAHVVLHLLRKTEIVPLTTTDPSKGLWRCRSHGKLSLNYYDLAKRNVHIPQKYVVEPRRP